MVKFQPRNRVRVVAIPAAFNALSHGLRPEIIGREGVVEEGHEHLWRVRLDSGLVFWAEDGMLELVDACPAA